MNNAADGTQPAARHTTTLSAGPSGRPLWLRLLFSEYQILALTVLYFLVILVFARPEGFATSRNFIDIVSNALPLLVVAIGQTVVLITAGIDLSVTAVIAVASVLGADVMTSDGGWLAGSPLAAPAAIAVMLFVGAAIGSLNGAAITRLSMPPFIVTLTTWMFFGGFAIWFTQSQSVYGLPDSFTAIGEIQTWRIAGRYLVRVPLYPLLVAASVAIVVHVLLAHTIRGRHLYAIGHNLRAAIVSGVPAKRTILFAYVVSGLCAAVGAILYTARLEYASPEQGEKILLDVIGAAVIGGTSLFGGKGKVIWTVSGVLLIVVIDNSLTMMHLSFFTVMIVKGSVILFAALVDTLRNRLLAGR